MQSDCGVRLKRGGVSAAVRALACAGAVAVLVTVALSCAGGPEAVRIGTEGAYPPYNFIDDEGELDGFERELGDELCRRADVQCTWVLNEWDTIIANLMAGEFDAIMAGMSITEEREERIDFTQPYVPPTSSVYIALAGAGDEVVAGTVAVQAVTVQSAYLAEAGATLVEYDLAPEVVAAVLDGEADAALVDLGFARDSIDGSNGALTIVGPSVALDQGIGIGVRDGDDALREAFDEALRAMKADGSLNALIDKWFGPSAQQH